MSDQFHLSDQVVWNSSQGEIHGSIVKIIREETVFDGQTFCASKEEPMYQVMSDKTGALAIHKATALNMSSQK